jgi:crotonobetainyl-CoA:carnitine CoA-transferase CaiB-like acyl-CoA transferase
LHTVPSSSKRCAPLSDRRLLRSGWRCLAKLDDLPTDPQILANNMLMDAPVEFGGGPIIDNPLNIDGLARVPLKAPPALGQHSREILLSIGYAETEIDRLATQGVI